MEMKNSKLKQIITEKILKRDSQVNFRRPSLGTRYRNRSGCSPELDIDLPISLDFEEEMQTHQKVRIQSLQDVIQELVFEDSEINRTGSHEDLARYITDISESSCTSPCEQVIHCPYCSWSNLVPQQWQKRIDILCENCKRHLYNSSQRKTRKDISILISRCRQISRE